MVSVQPGLYFYDVIEKWDSLSYLQPSYYSWTIP